MQKKTGAVGMGEKRYSAIKDGGGVRLSKRGGTAIKEGVYGYQIGETIKEGGYGYKKGGYGYQKMGYAQRFPIFKALTILLFF